MHPSKDLKVRKVTKKMDNGESVEVVEAVEEDEFILFSSTMKIKVTSHLEVVVVVNEEVEYVEPIKVRIK